MSASRARVVVTGTGYHQPASAATSPSTWDALVKGQSGVRHLDDEWAENLPVKIAGRIAVEPTEVLERVKARRLDRSSQFAMVAAMEAWARLRARRRRRRPRAARGRDGVGHRRRHDVAVQLRHPAREGPATGLAAGRPDADAERAGRADQPVRRCPGRGEHAGLGVRLRQRGHLAGARPDPARPRRHRAGRRHRGSDPPAADGGVREHDGAVEEHRRPDHASRGRGTPPATGSCSARAPACWCSSPRSTRRPAARRSTPRCSAPASPPTPTTSPSPTRPAAVARARSCGRSRSRRSRPPTSSTSTPTRPRPRRATSPRA